MRQSSGGRHAVRRKAPRTPHLQSRLQPRVAAVSAAIVLTALPVTLAVAAHGRSDVTDVAVDSATVTSAAPAGSAAGRSEGLSRSGDRTRMRVVPAAAPIVKTTPSPSSSPSSDPSTYSPPDGLSDAPCPDSSVEHGLAADTIVLYRAVCHAFPQVTHYLGWGPRPEHDTGHAIDVMVYGDKALGDQIAAWAQAHASELNLYDVLWYQRIWTPVRASEGWRPLPDRGSATANHMDHVHIGTN